MAGGEAAEEDYLCEGEDGERGGLTLSRVEGVATKSEKNLGGMPSHETHSLQAFANSIAAIVFLTSSFLRILYR